MDFIGRGCQPVVDQKPRKPTDKIFNSDIRRQSKTSTYPNRFSRDRCLLLLRFLIFLSLGATVFQMAMFVLFYRPSYLLVLEALLIISAIILIVALRDFRSILKLRSEAKRLER
ncbi:MAG: hypothetical protein RTV72_17570 [Candidatus Thorarchaeota archaeon]